MVVGGKDVEHTLAQGLTCGWVSVMRRTAPGVRSSYHGLGRTGPHAWQRFALTLLRGQRIARRLLWTRRRKRRSHDVAAAALVLGEAALIRASLARELGDVKPPPADPWLDMICWLNDGPVADLDAAMYNAGR